METKQPSLNLADIAQKLKEDLDALAGVSVIEVKTRNNTVLVACQIQPEADVEAATIGGRYQDDYGILVDLRVRG